MLAFNSLKHFFVCLIVNCSSPTVHANADLISLFPLNNYDQAITTWLKPTATDYNSALLNPTTQQTQFHKFYNHYFGSSSPWNAAYITKILRQATPDDLKSIEQSILANFSNQNKPENQMGYASNFRPYSLDWVNRIAININIDQLTHLSYHSSHRGIAIDNLNARVLPTEEPHFYSHKLAGQGYPFDNLQMSALWAGTPVYIVYESRDHAWDLVITPDYIAWVKSTGIAQVNNRFVTTWSSTAKLRLAAVTHNQTSIVDEKGLFRYLAYTGAVFPVTEHLKNFIKVMVPVSDENQIAVIHTAAIATDKATLMPLAATPHHFADVMRSSVGRPYGWGNLYFNNDCSAELKNLFTAFGIWLPRHSSDQVFAGKLVDRSAALPEERLAYLITNGHRLMTIIYIGGHVILYLGNSPNPNSKDHAPMAMTYQAVWGLSPTPGTRRAVIGQAVLFPLLLHYPEDTSLRSLAAKKYFQISYLDELPDNASLLKLEQIDLRALMYP